MQWRKMLATLLLLAVLSLAICACGPSKSGDASTASGAAPETISGEDAEANTAADDAGYQEDEYKDN